MVGGDPIAPYACSDSIVSSAFSTSYMHMIPTSQTLDDLTNPNYDFERLSVIRAVEDSAILQTNFVVNKDFLALHWTITGLAWGKDLFRDTFNEFYHRDFRIL